MERGNHTLVTEFILLGFSDHPDLQIILFLVFLLIYIVTLLGNLGIILLTRFEARLHTPMYFFLSHLSFIDICYSSSITPRLLTDINSEAKEISFSACAAQMYLFIMFVVAESFLLAVMAYDRYMAICNPLLYTVVMSRKLCIQLVAGSYMWGIVCALVHTVSAFRVIFCGPNSINHFFCDVLPVLALSCSDTRINKMLLFIFATFVETSTIIIILISYVLIIICVARIQSSKGKCKAFSTCVSHFTSIIIFHATILLIYCQPNASHSKDTGRTASVFYTIVIPMVNPLIYSLRNKEMKGAIKRLLEKGICKTVEHVTFIKVRSRTRRNDLYPHSGISLLGSFEETFPLVSSVPFVQCSVGTFKLKRPEMCVLL
ncbi:olfactory receptor 5D18-like [Elgaria multicarinata webbii]|uniref:olfactory receptor 5D18-like n=1 Tax=Elgaria multicarinata webbii TaxID=159646 RepID=UPI002FCD44C3